MLPKVVSFSKDIGTIRQRFWHKVQVGEHDECWLWLGCRNSAGYGCLWLPSIRRHVYAHRISVVLHGLRLPPGKIVHHTCGNRLCVNPRHLEVTTYSVNNMYESRKQGFFGGEPKGLQLRLEFDDIVFVEPTEQEPEETGS